MAGFMWSLWHISWPLQTFLRWSNTLELPRTKLDRCKNDTEGPGALFLTCRQPLQITETRLARIRSMNTKSRRSSSLVFL